MDRCAIDSCQLDWQKQLTALLAMQSRPQRRQLSGPGKTSSYGGYGAQSGRRRLSQHLDLQPFHLHSPPRLIGGEGRALQLPCLREARPIAERQPEAGGRRPQPA